MEVFWKQGYENTSMNDLLDAMGIQRGSFYNTFGSKKETYLRALDRYGQFMPEGGP
jgi:TetR/AcrR family transcriptional repressor of nem operon